MEAQRPYTRAEGMRGQEMANIQSIRPHSPFNTKPLSPMGYRSQDASQTTGWIPRAEEMEPLSPTSRSTRSTPSTVVRERRGSQERGMSPAPEGRFNYIRMRKGSLGFADDTKDLPGMTEYEKEFRADLAQMQKMPGDLLQKCHEQRHVLPAGATLARSLSPLGIGASLGSQYGHVGSQTPATLERIRKYHYEPLQVGDGIGPTSPVSSVMSPTAWSRRDDGFKKAENPPSFRPTTPKEGIDKDRRPSWRAIDQGYKFDWTATRDRCNISASGNRQKQLEPLKAYSPSVSQPLSPLSSHRLATGVPPYSNREPVLPDADDTQICDFSGWEDMNCFAGVKGVRPEHMWKEYNETRKKDLAASGIEIERKKGANAFSPSDPPPNRNLRPLWSQINEGYKCDWGIARDRYELHRFGNKDTLRPPTKPAAYFLY